MLSVTGQLLPLAVTPILTRLYGPDDFGLFAVFFAVIAVTGAIAGLRLEQAIIIEKTPAEATATLFMALGTAAVLTCLVAVVGYISVSMFAPMNAADYDGLFWISVGITSFALCAMNALTLVALRAKELLAPARAKFVQGIVQALVPVGLGLGGAGPAGLILGQMLGFLAGVATLAPAGLRLVHTMEAFSLQSLRSAWTRQQLYRLYAAPALLLNTGSKMLPIIVLAAFWSEALAGQVAVAQRLLFAPARLLGQTVSQFYIARAAPLTGDDPPALRRLFLNHVVLLTAAGAVIFMPIFAASSDMVAVLLGEEWRSLSYVLHLLIPLAWADFVLFPVGQTFNLIAHHKAGLAIDLALAISIAAVFLLGYSLDAAGEQVILYWSLGTFACYSAALVYGYVLLRRMATDMLKQRNTAASPFS